MQMRVLSTRTMDYEVAKHIKNANETAKHNNNGNEAAKHQNSGQ